MSEPNVLVNFRLDRDRPMRVKWLATDGVPGDGYKAQVTVIRLDDGATLGQYGIAGNAREEAVPVLRLRLEEMQPVAHVRDDAVEVDDGDRTRVRHRVRVSNAGQSHRAGRG